MLSPKKRELFIQAIDRARKAIARTNQTTLGLRRLAHALEQFAEIECGPKPDDVPLNPDEVERLLRLNQQLVKVEALIDMLSGSLKPVLANKVADLGDPMQDYEIDVKLDYSLREDDPEWDEDSDNVLSQREQPLTPDDIYPGRVHLRGLAPADVAAITARPHGWLFRDLTSTDRGLNMPVVPPRECLRLGTVFVDVVIRQQYQLNLDTGEWEDFMAPQREAG